MTERIDRAPEDGGALEAYFRENHVRATEEALSAAARARGHSDAAIKAAWAGVHRSEAAVPVRAQGRRIVLGLYAVTFAALVLGMVVNNFTYSLIGIIVLAVSMLIGLALSLFMVRRAGPEAAMAAVLAGPVIVLVILAGVCVATGLPTHSSGSI